MTLQHLDVTTLSLRDALDLAILIEEEAEERYSELAHQMALHDTPDAARFFERMAANEARHRAELTARRRDRFPGAPCTVTRAMLWDVEAPGYDEARAFMTERQAMETALRSEEKAEAFFAAALPVVRDADVQALFTQLRAEEVQHQARVAAELAKLAPEPALDPDDFADEPTAQ
jgi:rubrerythrin